MPYPDIVFVAGFPLRLWLLTGLAGALVAVRVAGAAAVRVGLERRLVQDELMNLVVAAAGGGALVHLVAGWWPSLWFLGGVGPVSPWGAGLAAAAVAAWRWRRLPFGVWRLLDALAPAAAAGLAVGFLGTSVLGRPTSLPWGVAPLGGNPAHPVSVYLVLVAAGGGLLGWRFLRGLTFPGQAFLGVVMAVIVGLLLVEPVTVAEPRYGALTQAQVIYFAVGGAAWVTYVVKTSRGAGKSGGLPGRSAGP